MVSEVPSVIAGLAVGIALIVAFAVSIPPAFNFTAEKFMQKVGDLPEVKAFKSKYSDYTEEPPYVGTIAEVDFNVVRESLHNPNPPREADAVVTRALHLYVGMNQTGFIVVKLSCYRPELEPDWVDYPGTVDEIQNNRCLETMDTLG